MHVQRGTHVQRAADPEIHCPRIGGANEIQPSASLDVDCAVRDDGGAQIQRLGRRDVNGQRIAVKIHRAAAEDEGVRNSHVRIGGDSPNRRTGPVGFRHVHPGVHEGAAVKDDFLIDVIVVGADVERRTLRDGDASVAERLYVEVS